MRQQTGFTMLELLITMVVGAILVAIAVPNFKTTIQNNRLTSQLNTALSGLVYARSEAIKRNTNVVICASSDQQSCSGSATGWNSGWIVYYTPPPASSTSAVPAPVAAEIIRQYPTLSGGNTLKSGVAQVVFQASGMTTLTSDSQFSLCDSRGVKYGRIIMVGTTGRAEVLPGSSPPWGGATLTPGC